MTQVFYIEPKLYGALPSICRATKCLGDALQNSNYCDKHQHLIKPPHPVWHKKQVVYIIGVDGEESVKIGYSSDFKTRLSSIQTSNPKNIHVVAIFEGKQNAERAIHGELRQYNVRGEWYYGKVVENFIIDLILDGKLRKSLKLGRIFALSDNMRYIITNNGSCQS